MRALLSFPPAGSTVARLLYLMLLFPFSGTQDLSSCFPLPYFTQKIDPFVLLYLNDFFGRKVVSVHFDYLFPISGIFLVMPPLCWLRFRLLLLPLIAVLLLLLRVLGSALVAETCLILTHLVSCQLLAHLSVRFIAPMIRRAIVAFHWSGFHFWFSRLAFFVPWFDWPFIAVQLLRVVFRRHFFPIANFPIVFCR